MRAITAGVRRESSGGDGTSIVRLSSAIDEKDVVRKFLSDSCVSADDVRQSCRLDTAKLRASELARIPESIAIPQPLELFLQHLEHERANQCSANMIFSEAANPKFQIVNMSICGRETTLDLGVVADLSKVGSRLEAHADARFIVGRHAVIPAALDVQ